MTSTRLIPLSQVIIPTDRQRREFDENDNQDLITSIQSIGLLQAPVLELVEGSYILRAGERRYRAISDIYDLGGDFSYDGSAIPEGLLPHTLWTDLTEVQRLEIEVEENEQRVAFTWQERSAATAKLVRLRQMQANAAGLPDPTVADIAVEVRGSKLGSAHTATRNDLILAQHLHNPAVAKAKTAAEALLILKKVEQAAYHLRLAEMQGDRGAVRGHTCVNADSEEWCAGQVGSQFDVIITDPPYGIGADTFGESQDGTTNAHGYSDSEDIVNLILGWFPGASYQLTKPQAHLYMFLDIDWFHIWKDYLTRAGWKVFRTPLIWIRPTGFRTPWIEQGPQRKYETIIYAVKGEKHCNMIAPDVITLQSAGEGLGHPAAKPAAIYTELLRRSVKPGDAVLDLFAGTGPVFAAASELKCSATGVEIDKTFYGIALAQLAKLTDQGELL